MKLYLIPLFLVFALPTQRGFCQASLDEKSQAENRQFKSSGDLFSLNLDSLSESNLTPSEKVVQPKITSVVHFEGDPSLKIAIVYTKIRPDYPQGDEVIDTQKPKFEQMQRAIGDAFVLTDTTSDGKRLLTYTLDGETYEKTVFPFGVTRGPLADGRFSIGAHRFIVRNGYFFEIACVLTTEDASADQRRANVLARLDAVTGALVFPH